MDVRDLLAASVDFTQLFDRARENKNFDRPWYAYDSLGNLDHFDRLLSAPYRDLPALCDGKPLLDIGCADGQLALFFNSLGLDVTAVDNPGTNANAMLGVRALKEAMGANIGIEEIDLDAGFQVPAPGKFGLTLLLGVLYHLQNPLLVLQKLSRHTRYCLLSTRVARRSPDGALDMASYPVAWLAGPDEINRDCTNFWIFSEPALRRAIERTGWRIRCFTTVGDTTASDPVAAEHDERAFCLIESVHALDHMELLDGWYPPESAGWRWTAPAFSVQTSRAAALEFSLWVPEATVGAFGAVTATARAGSALLAEVSWSSSGLQTWTVPLPAEARTSSVRVEIQITQPVPDDGPDLRRLGLIIASATLM